MQKPFLGSHMELSVGVEAGAMSLEDLPAPELFRKLQLQHLEADRLRDCLHARETDLSYLQTDLASQRRLLEQEKRTYEAQRASFETRILQLEQANSQLKTQVEDKGAAIQAANVRTTSLLAQQSQLQHSMKTLAYQAEVDTTITIKEREDQMKQRSAVLEQELLDARAQLQEFSQSKVVEFDRQTQESGQRLQQVERALSESNATHNTLKMERDAAIARAKEAEEVLELKRVAMAEKMKVESESSKYAREAAAHRVQREASATRAVRSEMELEVQKANEDAVNAKRECGVARRLQQDAESRLEPMIRSLDAARLEIEAKTAALWTAEEALKQAAASKLSLQEELDHFKINTNKGSAQNEALRRSLLDELESGTKYQDRIKALEKEVEQQRENIRSAYEVVESESMKAERAGAQAKRAKEVMENQMVQAKNLEQAFIQLKNTMKIVEVRFEGFTDLPEEFSGKWRAGPPTTFELPSQSTESSLIQLALERPI